MRYLLAILLLLGVVPAAANTFTVTSNQDSGPGTLRDAILQATAAGGANTITFNLPDQSQAGRTIAFVTWLPDLPGNLTIDGTTQPGAPFGISNARVIITNANPTTSNLNSFFIIANVSNIQIYGLWLLSAGPNNCFEFQLCNNLTFGAPGKGNLIQGFGQVFYSNFDLDDQNSVVGVTIQSNIMGTDPTGTTANAATLNVVDFWVRNVSNLQIGGLNPGEGNLLVESGYPMDYSSDYNNNFGFINIEGNIQGADITGLHTLSTNHVYFSIDGWDYGSNSPIGTAPVTINIINNISVGGFAFFEIAGPVTVQGNHLGVGTDNVTNLISGAGIGSPALLTFTDCVQGLIGGPNPANKNYIAYDSYGVAEYYSGDITISRNSFFCNQTGIGLNWASTTQPAPFANITGLTTSSISGTASANSTVELFYVDQCGYCEGKTYIGSTTADGSGNWSYAINPAGAIVVTATDSYGATSNFSTAVIDTASLVIHNATCGRNNGSIKNMQVISGTTWSWKDAQGNVVGTNPDLTGVGPGTYTFSVSMGGASCSATSNAYTITGTNLPAFDASDIQVTQTGCGQANGSFQYYGNFDTSTTYSWLSNGATICPDYSVANPLGDLEPGIYTLQLTLKQDPTCVAQYGPYTLVNQFGPTVNLANVVVTPASCGKSTGSITGISYQNAVPPVYYAWENDQNGKSSIAANTLDLTGVAPGFYRFLFKDGSTCDTIFTSLYTITDNGAITYDTSQMVVTPASCDLSNGSIVGIMSTNASTYTWVDGSNGATVGNLEDINGIGGGSYELSMSNAEGCQAQTPPISVIQLGYPGLPQVSDQEIPRNTSTTIVVANPQKYGWYELHDQATATSTILDTSQNGVLHTPSIPYDETLYVVFNNGACESPFAPVKITVFDSVKVYVPNAFSPNSDGANDRWRVIIQGVVKKLQVNVYNRLGGLVFESNDPSFSWDGTEGGRPLTGTYVYMIAGVDYFGKPFLLKGTLIIIR